MKNIAAIITFLLFNMILILIDNYILKSVILKFIDFFYFGYKIKVTNVITSYLI